MERAFLVNKESKYYQDYIKVSDMVNKQKQFVSKFLNENNIVSKEYYLSGNGFFNMPFDDTEKSNISFYIVPTENDNINFEKQLCKPTNDGLCAFKKNSKILKEFQQQCVDNQVIINIPKLDLRDYLKSMDWVGYSMSRIPCEEGFYLKVDSKLLKEDDNPIGFIPIKMSEFYNHLEEYNLKNKSC